MSELLRLEKICFAYGAGSTVLEDADFYLKKGEKLALTGKNGSGKTTLLHLLVGLLRPQGGDVFAFGQSRQSEQDFYEVRARAGLLFQDPEDQLFCPTVREDVAFGPLNLGLSRAEALSRVDEALALVGLEGYGARITYKMSGGEKRLVTLATVLAMRPEVILLDEPTSGLDEEAERRLVSVLGSLNMAMVLVSHDRGFLGKTANCAARVREKAVFRE